jgi:hypothetical protein
MTLGDVDSGFYDEVLRHLGVPITETNVKALIAWQAAEGGSARFNPFDTTEPYPGATNYNGVGVKNYPARDAGILATVKTLQLSAYAAIRAALEQGTSGRAVCQAIDASPWGTRMAAAVYRERFPHAP